MIFFVQVLNKFNRDGKGLVDFLDFVMYIPLFMTIHERIIKDPLREELDLWRNMLVVDVVQLENAFSRPGSYNIVQELMAMKQFSYWYTEPGWS